MVRLLDILMEDELIDVLNNEAEIYREVLKISRNKTRIIVEGKTSELENITRKEQALISRIADFEEIRGRIVKKFSEQFEKEAYNLTISSIINMLPQDKSQKLNSILADLSKSLKEIKEVNTLNSKLIKNSLEYIDFSINLLTGTGASGNLYGNSGQTNNGRKRNFLDVKL